MIVLPETILGKMLIYANITDFIDFAHLKKIPITSLWTHSPNLSFSTNQHLVRMKKYRSYKGKVGKIASNFFT